MQNWVVLFGIFYLFLLFWKVVLMLGILLVMWSSFSPLDRFALWRFNLGQMFSFLLLSLIVTWDLLFRGDLSLSIFVHIISMPYFVGKLIHTHTRPHVYFFLSLFLSLSPSLHLCVHAKNIYIYMTYVFFNVTEWD